MKKHQRNPKSKAGVEAFHLRKY